MSKIGQKSIPVSTAVQVTIADREITVKGTKGNISLTLPRILKIVQNEGNLLIERKGETKKHKSAHGLWRSLIANAVHGVDSGWSKKLEVVGTGFNAKQQGKGIVLRLGLSHPVEFSAPEDVQITVEGNNSIIISGVDKQRVGEIAQQIKSIKKPDAYKGKGIRYEGEHIKLKPGKKAKTA
ncbi:MAG: 50S ribosomal protein L6 [Candidatus Roizmanbacteria bacterium]|uniref:50S ribosomal protein L6 n=2 Tax=Candidatus Roizmaniibacteriota TaxID=1752723 RepID=A0A2M8EXI9_9BACT|nr:50S ribosomal protein L6 [Candidatus Roizmanbacteria bacterium]PIZ64976.1 MAG: 50S ribosomal protein L6 [Candidatus Roizmanbacteria bacterium CG_4_10_14_0_2_um_filter_39_12]PJC30761.1 MAG: 50S ribosomal protein L6 [Candidatus Roizmanbacteria bacterium CG_4_9_14_0_2_um_filter_39_13]PJE62280.1 MAG: 50S ribosomal protein L6 [Candidatus Roizmanbacteria bacterium CG10_big_fil_rev_8_21_14_0_10_39_12]